MLKVLIVDDEAVVRRGIVLGIDWASLGCAVVGEAANGEEGLAAAERYSPNLIITDVRMPHMDGIEMMRVLRERGSTAHVIVLTAYNDFDYARSALRFGAADYLSEALPRPGARRRHRARAREKAEAFSSPAARRTICWRCPRATRANMCSRRSNTSPRTTPTRTSTSPPSPAPSASAMSRPSEPCVQKGDELHRARLPHALPHPHGAQAPRRLAATRSTRSPAWSATAMSPTSARPSKSSPASPPRSIRTAAGRTRKLHKKVRNIPDKLGGLSQHFAETPAESQTCPVPRRRRRKV